MWKNTNWFNFYSFIFSITAANTFCKISYCNMGLFIDSGNVDDMFSEMTFKIREKEFHFNHTEQISYIYTTILA